jgi:hypothetical protein
MQRIHEAGGQFRAVWDDDDVYMTWRLSYSVAEMQRHATPFYLLPALSDTIVIDRSEIEDARWFSRDELALMLNRRHPDGLTTPPPVAIAHHLIRSFVEDGCQVLDRHVLA